MNKKRMLYSEDDVFFAVVILGTIVVMFPFALAGLASMVINGQVAMAAVIGIGFVAPLCAMAYIQRDHYLAPIFRNRPMTADEIREKEETNRRYHEEARQRRAEYLEDQKKLAEIEAIRKGKRG